MEPDIEPTPLAFDSEIRVYDHCLSRFSICVLFTASTKIHVILADDVYNGEDNSVVMQEKQIISFRCHLDLQLYPFDTQRCSIIIGVKDLYMKYGMMIKVG
ncbi:hypothetical protein Pcinc_008796 [Petrolisthes cinctipes]|uniref:Neurotransmitter-gated ion-channel ligand-binding domain-containing protein n=1 Tax=Petrolisthes cinctipes TaxID=88211 RepID=A0AAE1G5C6_PETCI|nr:hypothetical protein Pcinc_009103 [Petrolisthes cinctipes]KAK3887109.1 hypothetical protein Pcinc_008796 [Petrolisthes cinctipes]